MSALRVRGLGVAFAGRRVVDGVDLDVAPGECLAIVGESGAGKSLTALALLGLVPPGATVTADELSLGGLDARRLEEGGWRAVRGERIALVSQDALVSLDPLRRVGREVAEPLEIHEMRRARAERDARVLELLDEVAMPEAARRAQQYPHELSGGLRQRALIASALAASPLVLVADEPTTALDATVQLRILELLRRVADGGVAVIFISHDLTAVARIADRIAVMREGRIVEQGTADAVLRSPAQPYTRTLLAAVPSGERLPRAPVSAESPVVVEARGLRKTFGGRRETTVAVDDASFSLRRGRTLGIVGESGSGKSTLARLLLGLERPDAGEVLLHGSPWNPAAEAVRRPSRSRIQLVHQNPRAAFDPRWTIGRSLDEALGAGGVPRAERGARAAELLRLVELDPGLRSRRAREISGGQRQRAAIARALAAGPEVLVLDEPVSALDVSVQARVLELLARLQAELDLAMAFISHDLAVVASLADELLVMQDGRVVEQGRADAIFAAPRHPFTRALLDAAAPPTR